MEIFSDFYLKDESNDKLIADSTLIAFKTISARFLNEIKLNRKGKKSKKNIEKFKNKILEKSK